MFVGIRVGNEIFSAIVMRYSDKQGHIHFSDFVGSVIKLKTIFGKNLSILVHFVIDYRFCCLCPKQ